MNWYFIHAPLAISGGSTRDARQSIRITDVKQVQTHPLTMQYRCTVNNNKIYPIYFVACCSGRLSNERWPPSVCISFLFKRKLAKRDMERTHSFAADFYFSSQTSDCEHNLRVCGTYREISVQFFFHLRTVSLTIGIALGVGQRKTFIRCRQFGH